MKTFDEAVAELRFLKRDIPHDIPELRWLFDQVKEVDPDVYVEIGCRHGSGMYVLAQALQPGSHVIAIDMPNGPWGIHDSDKALIERIKVLREQGLDTELILGNSVYMSTVLKLERMLYEIKPKRIALFLDGDHRFEGIRQDFLIYRNIHPAVALVMFHDITPNPPKSPNAPGQTVGVGKLWKRIKEEGFNTDEFIDTGTFGVGVVYT